MECNKDDAIKAKEISERKLTEKDFAGAKKFSLKAQALYPGIEGLSQLITTIEVYLSAENKISGEVDWYGVLDVPPTADDETIKKQYRKRALMLHPDKNKSVAADGAFKLISEAWGVLSDKAKRLAYNQRRSSNKSSSTVKPPNTTSQANPNFTPRPSVPPQRNPTPAPHPFAPKLNSFWTACQKCKMHYEYLKIYLNQTLLCPHCQKPFKAIQTAPPSSNSKQSNPIPKSNQPAPPSNQPKPPTSFPNQRSQVPPQRSFVRNPATTAPHTGLGGAGGTKTQHFSFGKTAPVGPTVSSPAVAAKAANIVQQTSERLKRAREEAQGLGGWDKTRRVNGYVSNMPPQMAMGNKVYNFTGGKFAHISTRELTALETRKMLIKRAKTEIIKKLSELSSEDSTKSANSKKVNASNTKLKSSVKADKKGDQAKKSSKSSTKVDNDDVAINVPDPDFYEFDQDRMESCFAENQVWSAYDDDDGMPRFYALVHKVISLKPFKLRISWLEPESNSEFSNMNWVGAGFNKPCGEFKLGKPEFTKSLNTFSYKMKWVKSPTGAFWVLPQKGEVWALYRNWSPDWNKLTPDEVIHEYEMVEILEDYNEDKGVSIAPLVKVDGFRTVFRARTDPEYMKIIPKEEMLRFSHRIPNHLLTGEEAKAAPKGFQELDPASTPLESIQVVAEAGEKKADADEK